MATTSRSGGGAHLIGSVSLADTEAVFRTVAGWGRTDPQRLPGLLESHRIAAEALNGR